MVQATFHQVLLAEHTCRKSNSLLLHLLKSAASSLHSAGDCIVVGVFLRFWFGDCCFQGNWFPMNLRLFTLFTLTEGRPAFRQKKRTSSLAGQVFSSLCVHASIHPCIFVSMHPIHHASSMLKVQGAWLAFSKRVRRAFFSFFFAAPTAFFASSRFTFKSFNLSHNSSRLQKRGK